MGELPRRARRACSRSPRGRSAAAWSGMPSASLQLDDEVLRVEPRPPRRHRARRSRPRRSTQCSSACRRAVKAYVERAERRGRQPSPSARGREQPLVGELGDRLRDEVAVGAAIVSGVRCVRSVQAGSLRRCSGSEAEGTSRCSRSTSEGGRGEVGAAAEAERGGLVGQLDVAGDDEADGRVEGGDPLVAGVRLDDHARRRPGRRSTPPSPAASRRR